MAGSGGGSPEGESRRARPLLHDLATGANSTSVPVQHLDPHHRSMMVLLLASGTIPGGQEAVNRE